VPGILLSIGYDRVFPVLIVVSALPQDHRPQP